MSTAARARRTHRGTRQFLPIVLGLALLAAAMGAEQGHHPSSGLADPLTQGRPVSVISAPVGHQPVAADAGRDHSGSVSAPAGMPSAVSSGYPGMAEPAPVRAVAVAAAVPLEGRAPGADGARAPPSRGA
jgi:hypothetical protein